MNLKYDTEAVGCIHMHSVYSDGTEPIEVIADYADELGLDYIMISDHMTLKPLEDGMERWFGSTLALIGYEINDADDNNHYLAFGLRSEVNRHLPAIEYVKQVKENGGLGIIAHPDEKRDLMIEHPPYPWTAWESNDFTGIEVWNGLSEWMEGLTHLNMLYRFLHPRKSLIAPVRETVNRWDALNKHRAIVAVGGVDAHAHHHKVFGLIPVRIFHYKVHFKTIRTHILTDQAWNKGGDIETHKNIVYDALRNTRVFISNYRNGNAYGFRFWAEYGENTVEMGETVNYSGKARLYVNLPERADVIIFKNGVKTDVANAKEAEFEIEAPGIFRVEVHKKRKAWIFSNHIRFYE